MVVYLILAGMAAFGDRLGRVASALGGLVALTIVLAPPHPTKKVGPTNEPLIVSFFGWLAEMMTNPPRTISTATATAPAGSKSVNPQIFTPGTKHTPGLTGITNITGGQAPGQTGGTLGGIR